MTFRVSERVVRGMTAATGAALFLSLFLTWSATGLNRRGFLVVFGALHHLPVRTGWETYSVADVLLAGVVVLLISAAVLRRRRVDLLASILVVCALVFEIHALADPPTLSQVTKVGASFVLVFGAASGPGQIVALAATGTAFVCLILLLIPNSVLTSGRWSGHSAVGVN